MIYLDNAATTKVNKKVLESMMPYFSEIYCNPSAAYSFATKGRIAIEEARNHAAKLIGASDMEIYFTSGGSESDNWAHIHRMEQSRVTSSACLRIVTGFLV